MHNKKIIVFVIAVSLVISITYYIVHERSRKADMRKYIADIQARTSNASKIRIERIINGEGAGEYLEVEESGFKGFFDILYEDAIKITPGACTSPILSIRTTFWGSERNCQFDFIISIYGGTISYSDGEKSCSIDLDSQGLRDMYLLLESRILLFDDLRKQREPTETKTDETD